MYNIYVEEKKQKQANDQRREEQRKLNYTERHKKDKSSLLFNYNARVKDFILDMASSEFSLPQKNVDKPILNTRLQYIEETKDKIKGRRGFLFFGYKSEKDRINEAVAYNKILSASVPLEPNSASQSPQEKIRSKCSQPEMRFKPKSNIERVREAVNLNYFGKVESEIINGQLSSIRDKVKRRMFSMGNSSSYATSGFVNINNESNEEENKYVIIPNVGKKIAQLKYSPMPIRRIIKDYDYNSKHNTLRTHFKAVEAVALNSLSPSNSSQDLTKSHQKLRFNGKSLMEGCKGYESEEKDDAFINQYSLISNRSQVNMTPKIENYLKHKNPNNRREISWDNKVDLKLLKEIAFINGGNNSGSNEIVRGKVMNAEDIKMHEDKITIGNETFGIQSDIQKIAGRVLNRCNYHFKKNKNNSTKLEAKTGKLMATHGLTIKDFLVKYHLPG